VTGKIIKKNTIVNLSVLLNLVAYTKSLPSSIQTPIIKTSGGTAGATYSIQQYENGYVFIFTATFQPSINIKNAMLYPYSMSLFTQPLASITYTQEIIDVVAIEWAIYVEDTTGVLTNLIPPQIIPNTDFLEALYVDDNNVNALLNLNNYNHYLYAYFYDSTSGNPITQLNVHFFTFLDYNITPSAVKIKNNLALQLVPASYSEHTVFYYIWNSQSLTMQFTFGIGTSPLGDGFAICLYSTTPPIAFNTSTPSGMTDGTLAYGSGNQIVVEFDPYASQPISVTWWTSSGYKQTILASSGAGTGTSMTEGDIFEISIQVSGTSMTITVTDLTINKVIASQTVTLPFTPPNTYYVIVTARNNNGNANWSLVNISNWYPYSVQITVNYTSPQLLAITATYESD
jgi:hypothetical protein